MIVPHQPLRGGRSILQLVAPAQHPPKSSQLPYPREPLDFARQPASPELAARLEAFSASVVVVSACLRGFQNV